MLGMLCRSEGRVRLEQLQLLGLPVLCARLPSGGRWEGRRLERATRLLARQGVRRVLPGRDFECWDALEHRGLRPVDPLPLYRAMAAEFAIVALTSRRVELCHARVALLGKGVDADLSRAARELCPQVRTLILGVEHGRERLARELYWEFGAAVGIGGSADVYLRFSGPSRQGELVLCGVPELLGLRLEAPGLELPQELEPVPLLTALWQAGGLNTKQLKVDLEGANTCKNGHNML